MKSISPTRHIQVPLYNNPLLSKAVEAVNNSEEIRTLWRVINVHAIDRLQMTDHGLIHFQIVANIGLKLARMLDKHGVEFSVVKDFGLTKDHAEVIIFLGCVLHDIGMSVARSGHEEFSIPLANQLMREMLTFLPTPERTIVISETLHAIISHRRSGQPVTIEAGIVRIADALDMSEGRSRIPYDAGSINIHSISAQAIDKITIAEGTDKPIKITIQMNNSAGIFQIDELLKEKMSGSGIEQYFEITAVIEAETEKKLIKKLELK
jgi:hypothetical protein